MSVLQEQRDYAALCDRARELGVPVSLDDRRSERTVAGLMTAVALAEPCVVCDDLGCEFCPSVKHSKEK